MPKQRVSGKPVISPLQSVETQAWRKNSGFLSVATGALPICPIVSSIFQIRQMAITTDMRNHFLLFYPDMTVQYPYGMGIPLVQKTSDQIGSGLLEELFSGTGRPDVPENTTPTQPQRCVPERIATKPAWRQR